MRRQRWGSNSMTAMQKLSKAWRGVRWHGVLCVSAMLFSLLCLMTSLSHADILCDGADDLILTGAPTGNLVTFGTGTLTVWVTVNGATKNAPEYWNGYGILGDDGANIGMWRGLWAGNGTDMLYGAG